MTIKNETECVQKLPHMGPGFRSCIRVRVRKTCGHARVQPNSSSEYHFCPPPPPPARVGLVVKHVIKLQWSSKGFTYKQLTLFPHQC
ncbi:hypothetical protein Hanom_Chr15g01366091 [Helianthus anomalus]